jgi:CBS domain-containing protein
MKVADVMAPNPVCCIAQNSALDAAWLMRAHNLGCLPVVSGPTTRRLIGIVTDRDLCMAVIPRGCAPSSVKVAQAMTAEPIVCLSDDDLEDCLALMRQHSLRRMPVVDKHGACVGLISQTDFDRLGHTDDRLGAKRTLAMSAV